MASAASIMRSALRTTSPRALRSRSPHETYAVTARPNTNMTSNTRLNFSLRPMSPSSLALVEPRVRAGEADQAEGRVVSARGRPFRPEPKLDAGHEPALELLDQRRITGLEHGCSLVAEPVHEDDGVPVHRDADVPGPWVE